MKLREGWSLTQTTWQSCIWQVHSHPTLSYSGTCDRGPHLALHLTNIMNSRSPGLPHTHSTLSQTSSHWPSRPLRGRYAPSSFRSDWGSGDSPSQELGLGTEAGFRPRAP